MNRKLLGLLVALVAMFWCLGSARAHDFIGETVSAGKFYIRNNKTKTYIKNNSTSLSTSIDEACLFTLVADGSKYKFKNENGKYLTWNATAGSAGNLKTNENSGYAMTFQTSDGGRTYRFYYDGTFGNPYLYLDGQQETSKLTKGTGDGKNSEQAYWELISEEQVKALADTDKDASGKIHNANGNYNPKYAWTLSGNVIVLQGEDNKGKDGKVGIVQLAEWGNANGFDCSMSQTVTDLPDGYYKLTVDCQASEGSTLKIFAGSEEITTISKGVGWETYEVEAAVTGGTLTIGARGTADSQFQWTNVDNFKLTYRPFVKEIVTKDDVITATGVGFSGETITVGANITTVDLRGATGSIDVDVTANPNALIYTKGITVNKTDNVIVNGSCDNLVLVDGYPFRAAWQFEAGNAKYTMTAVASNSNVSFGTIMIPFAATSMPDGVKIYALDKELNFGNEILATSTTSVAANTPLLVTKAGDYSAEVASVDATKNTYTNGKLTGTYSKIDTAEEGSYVLQKHDDRVAFFLVGNASQTPTKPSVNPFRAYVTASQANGAKARFISVMFDDESTGILQIAEDGTTNVGRGQIYDLMGRKVVNPSNGIYVVNGKKVFIK